MLRKKMTYTNFNGVEVTETFCFHLTQAEIMQMELETVGGYQGFLQKILDAKDVVSMIKVLNEFIDMSYGVLSEDGKYFTKSEEDLKRFKATQAYSDLYMSLLDPDAASAFINAVAPSIPKVENANAGEEAANTAATPVTPVQS